MLLLDISAADLWNSGTARTFCPWRDPIRSAESNGRPMTDFTEREVALATELAFLALRDAFDALAAHLTLDGANPDALLVLEARVEMSLERAIQAREDELRPEIGAHAAGLVRTIIREAHASTVRARADWGREAG